MLLDVILLAALIAGVELELGALAMSFVDRSSRFDCGDGDAASAQVSFDDAIRDHLELKRRNDPLERPTSAFPRV